MEKRCWDLPPENVGPELFHHPSFRLGVRFQKWLAGWKEDFCPFLADQKFNFFELEDKTKEGFIPAMYPELEAFISPELFFRNIAYLVKGNHGVLIDSYPGNLAFVWVKKQFCLVSIAHVGPWEIEIYESDDSRLWPTGTRLLSRG